MRFILALLFTICFAHFAPAQPLSKPEKIPVDDKADYVHQPSDMHFPPSVGVFNRGDIHKFTVDATDVAVGYDVFNAGVSHITMTVYIAPANGRTPRKYFDDARGAINRFAKDATEVANEPATLKQGDRSILGLHAVFTMTRDYNGNKTPVRSELYVFENKGQLVKYRITYPTDGADAAAKHVATFMETLTLPAE